MNIQKVRTDANAYINYIVREQHARAEDLACDGVCQTVCAVTATVQEFPFIGTYLNYPKKKS
jgi:hypothetical protein